MESRQAWHQSCSWQLIFYLQVGGRERLGLVWALETSVRHLLQGHSPNPSQTVLPTGVENIKIHELIGAVLIRASTGPELCWPVSLPHGLLEAPWQPLLLGNIQRGCRESAWHLAYRKFRKWKCTEIFIRLYWSCICYSCKILEVFPKTSILSRRAHFKLDSLNHFLSQPTAVRRLVNKWKTSLSDLFTLYGCLFFKI